VVKGGIITLPRGTVFLSGGEDQRDHQGAISGYPEIQEVLVSNPTLFSLCPPAGYRNGPCAFLSSLGNSSSGTKIHVLTVLRIDVKTPIHTQVNLDGPTLFVRFEIPAEFLSCPMKQWDPSRRVWCDMLEPHILDQKLRSLEFIDLEGQEAYDMLMTLPSPARPVINLP